MAQKDKNEAIKDFHNVQIPAQIFMHPEIDPYTFKVFAYMKFRYQFFTLKGMSFHESNTTIGEAIGISRSKVIDAINKLISLGFVVRQARHGAGSEKGNQTNIYIVMDVLTPNGKVVKQENKVKQVPNIPQFTPRTKEIIPEPHWGDDPF